jgi:hypothetical protein
LVSHVEQMAQGAGRAREPGDDEEISRAQVVQSLVELGPPVDLSGRLVNEDAVAASLGEGVTLTAGVLLTEMEAV